MPERSVLFPQGVLAPTATSRRGQDTIFFRHLDVSDSIPASVCVHPHPAEDFLDHLFPLPVQERERLAGEPAFRVDEEVLEEGHRVSGLSLVEVVVEPLLKRLGLGQTLPADRRRERHQTPSSRSERPGSSRIAARWPRGQPGVASPERSRQSPGSSRSR